LSNGDAGTQLARIFAATLTLSSVFLFLLGMLLLRADRNRLELYLLPLAVGLVIGLLESWMFLEPQSPLLLLAPLFLLLLLLRPIRRALASMFRGKRTRA
jgi:hypothetical protein